MDATQFARWKEFSLAMALRGFEGMTEARRKRLHEEVEGMLYSFEYHKVWADFKSWDHNEENCDNNDDCSSWVSELMENVQGYWRMPENPEFEWRFSDQIHCCLRAGIDLASSPSAGVVGFDCGDLRRMFGGSIPNWISDHYITETTPNGLHQLDDRERVWL